MEQYKQEFIEFMVDSEVLKFGEFTLICRSEKHIEIIAIFIMNGMCVVLTQFL